MLSLSPAHSSLQVAPEYEARLAKILAVEDEDTMCLADGMEKMQTVAGAGMKGSMNFDPSTKMHHDAIFAPTGQAVPEATAECAPPAPVPASVVAGVMGAAARARLVLTGKVGEELATPKSPPQKTRTKTFKTEKLPKPRKDEGEQPLFKTLQVYYSSTAVRSVVAAEGRVTQLLFALAGPFTCIRQLCRIIWMTLIKGKL